MGGFPLVCLVPFFACVTRGSSSSLWLVSSSLLPLVISCSLSLWSSSSESEGRGRRCLSNARLDTPCFDVLPLRVVRDVGADDCESFVLFGSLAVEMSWVLGICPLFELVSGRWDEDNEDKDEEEGGGDDDRECEELSCSGSVVGLDADTGAVVGSDGDRGWVSTLCWRLCGENGLLLTSIDTSCWLP